MRFVALMLRLQDLLFMTQEKAASAFREEALRDMREAMGDRAKIVTDETVSKELNEFKPDVLSAPMNGFQLLSF